MGTWKEVIPKNKSLNEKKFRELIIYLAKRSQGDIYFGATKLNKLLFYCDFSSYRMYGKSITGSMYQKLQWGPAPRYLKPIQEKMIADGDIDIQHISFGNGIKQARAVALRDPDISRFSKEEIALIEDVIDRFRMKNASEVSLLSPEFIGWKVVEFNSDIPYCLSLVGDREPSAYEIKYGNSLIDLAKRELSKYISFHARP